MDCVHRCTSATCVGLCIDLILLILTTSGLPVRLHLWLFLKLDRMLLFLCRCKHGSMLLLFVVSSFCNNGEILNFIAAVQFIGLFKNSKLGQIFEKRFTLFLKTTLRFCFIMLALWANPSSITGMCSLQCLVWWWSWNNACIRRR